MDNTISKAIVDKSGFGKTINDVLSSFSVLEFMDFCTILEGIVLYDQLVVVGNLKLNTTWEEQFSLLEKNNVISEPTESFRPINNIERPERNRNNRDNKIRDISRSSMEDAWYETGRLVGAEQTFNISPLPLLRQRPYYEKAAVVKENHTLCDLFAQYDELSKALTESRNVSRFNFAPYFTLPIPPIPLLVMQRSKRKEDFLYAALELRVEFESLRNSLRDLRQELADPYLSPKKKLKRRRSWAKSWNTLSKYKEYQHSISIADKTQNIVNIEKSLDGVGIDSLQVSKILERIIQMGEKEFYKWRIRIMHSTAKKYLKTSDGQINNEIQRFYQYEISKRDVDILRQYGFY